MRDSAIMFRRADASDLDALNAVVESCVMGWNLSARVKRLALSSYLYDAHDLDYMEILLAESAQTGVVGVAAIEPAAAAELPEGRRGLLLHGLYVEPRHQGQGVGSLLVGAVLENARRRGLDGLLVKAQADAVGFFSARGFTALAVKDAARDYADRWWKPA